MVGSGERNIALSRGYFGIVKPITQRFVNGSSGRRRIWEFRFYVGWLRSSLNIYNNWTICIEAEKVLCTYVDDVWTICK